MKKGHTEFILKYTLIKLLMVTSIIFFLALILSITSNKVLATTSCSDGSTETECVCGHTPNSSQGYGQVVLGGAESIIISCNNNLDLICPEDFEDTTQTPTVNGNCSQCPDPDCTVSSGGGYVWGYVTDSSSGKPLEGAVVTSHPIKWNVSSSLDTNATTRTDGMYNSTSFISGKYYFSASKDGYDTQLIEGTVIRGSILRMDFTLQNGSCHKDCTNSYNRCNAACDGISFDTTTCKFYNSTVKEYCNNKIKNTEVYLGPDSDIKAWFIRCCDSTPYTKYYYKAYINGNNIKNLIKTEKIARYNDVPVKVVIAYW